jgi:hypothetical protein
MVFIRFNPDGKGVTLKKKLEKLVGEIHTQIRRIKAGDNRELLEVEYLFYPQDLRAGLVGARRTTTRRRSRPRGCRRVCC